MEESNEPPITDPELDPRVTLRSDLWAKMTISELARQQEICIDRINALYQLMGSAGSPSMVTMFRALTHANQQLTQLISSRSETRQRRPNNLKERNGKG